MENAPTNRSLGYFIILLIGHSVSLFGGIITNFMIMWYVIESTGWIIYVQLLNLTSVIPFTVVLFIGSVFSDLFNRRVLLIILNILKIINLIILIFLIRFEIMGYGGILFFNCIVSIFHAFYLPTFFSILPTMIPQKHFSRINGLAYLMVMIVQFTAPILASYLLMFFEIYQILWVEVISIGIALFSLIFIKTPRIQQENRNFKLNHYFKHFINGFRAIRLVPGLIILFVSIIMLEVLIHPVSMLFPIYVMDVHSVNYPIYQTLVFFYLIGGVIGVIVTLIRENWNPTILMFFISACIIMARGLILTLIPSRSFLLLFLNETIVSFFLVIPQMIFLTIIQVNISRDKIGRVYGIYLAFSSFISFIAFIHFGPIFSIFDIKVVFLIISITGIIAFILIFSLTRIKNIKFRNYIAQEDYFQIEKKN